METALETQFEICAYPECIACSLVAVHDHKQVTRMHAWMLHVDSNFFPWQNTFIFAFE